MGREGVDGPNDSDKTGPIVMDRLTVGGEVDRVAVRYKAGIYWDLTIPESSEGSRVRKTQLWISPAI